MPSENTSTSASAPDVTKLLAELEIPFPPDQVRWRVTNTSNDKKRGQIVPYADSRAYTDRLNAPRHEDALPPGLGPPIAIAAPIPFSPSGSATTSCLLSSLLSSLKNGIRFGPVTIG